MIDINSLFSRGSNTNSSSPGSCHTEKETEKPARKKRTFFTDTYFMFEEKNFKRTEDFFEDSQLQLNRALLDIQVHKARQLSRRERECLGRELDQISAHYKSMENRQAQAHKAAKKPMEVFRSKANYNKIQCQITQIRQLQKYTKIAPKILVNQWLEKAKELQSEHRSHMERLAMPEYRIQRIAGQMERGQFDALQRTLESIAYKLHGREEAHPNLEGQSLTIAVLQNFAAQKGSEIPPSPSSPAAQTNAIVPKSDQPANRKCRATPSL